MAKNSELDCLVSSLSLLRKIYIESEINDDAVVYITNDKFPRLHNELLTQIGKLERIIASQSMQDLCVNPDCDCLDYCEAVDPYSATPAGKMT